MAQEQTAYAGDDIKVLVNVIGSTGAHVAAVINTTTTRLDGLSAAPTVTTVATGIYQIVFSGVTPAPAEGDRYTCKINGTIAGVAWSEYGIPVKIVADERGTDNVVVPTSDITAIKAKTDQLAFTVSNQVDANALTGGGGDDSATIYNYFTASSREDAFKATGFNTVTPDNVSISAILADTNELQTNQGDWATATGFNTIAPDNASISAILADTNELQTNQGDWATATGFATVNPDNASITAIKTKTDQLVFTVANQVDANALTGGGGDDAATIYNYFTGSNRQDTFKATGFNTVAPDNASVANILADTNELQQNQGDWLTATGFATVNPDNTSIALILADTNELQTNQNQWVTATGFNTVAPDNSSITAIKSKTDNFVFTIPNQVDANTLTLSGGGDATLANQTSIIGMLSGASVVVSQSDLKVGDSVTLRQGMDYSNLDGTAISWTGSSSDQWPDLTGATVTFTAVQGSKIITQTVTVTSPTGTQAFYVEFTAAELSATNAPTGNYRYYITALLSNGRKTTLITDSTLRIAEPYSSGE